jgi:hypothetical protein
MSEELLTANGAGCFCGSNWRGASHQEFVKIRVSTLGIGRERVERDVRVFQAEVDPQSFRVA